MPNTVMLDAGHGGADSGIRAMEFTEKELALDIVLRLKDNLEAEGIQDGDTVSLYGFEFEYQH